MKSLLLSVTALHLLSAPLHGASSASPAPSGSLDFFATVPEEASKNARASAAALLGRYLKSEGDGHLCQQTAAFSNTWVEIKGLKITRITPGSVTKADEANGILEWALVSLGGDTHRTFKSGDSKWSAWNNGMPPLFPGSIQVVRRADGQWVASAFGLDYFSPIGNPSSTVALATASAQTSTNLSSGTTSQPTRSAPPTYVPTTPRNSNPPNAKVSGLGQPDKLPWPAAAVEDTPLRPISRAFLLLNEEVRRAFKWTFVAVFCTAFAPLLVTIISRKNRTLRMPDKSRPPPLPALSQDSEQNPIDLVQRRDNLMTPAELAFFAVLEPIVRSSYMISSKVRLADLFDVRPEGGQQAAFNKLSSKHIDFVLTDYQTSRILCGIELDDSSHSSPDRIARDRFVNELFADKQLPLLRVPHSWIYYPVALREALVKVGLTIPESNQTSKHPCI